MSIMTSASDLNDEIKQKVYHLDKKGLSHEEICMELKYLYGNHVISNRKDRTVRTEFDF